MSKISVITDDNIKDISESIIKFFVEDSNYDIDTVMKSLSVLDFVLTLHQEYNVDEFLVLFESKALSFTHQYILDQLNLSMNYSEEDLTLSEAIYIAQKNLDKHVFYVMQDQSLNRGSVYEALLQIPHMHNHITVVLCDEKMSLLKEYNSFDQMIKNIRISKTYNSLKNDLKSALDNKVSRPILDSLTWIRDQVKESIIEPSIFSQFHMNYHGPIDGSNLNECKKIVHLSRKFKFSSLIHLETRLHHRSKYFLNFPQFKVDKERPKNYYTQIELLDRFLIQRNGHLNFNVFTDANHLSEHLTHFAQKYPEMYYPFYQAKHAMLDAAFRNFLDGHNTVIFLSNHYASMLIPYLAKYNIFMTDSTLLIVLYEAGIRRFDRSEHISIDDFVIYPFIKENRAMMPSNHNQMLDFMEESISETGISVLRIPLLLSVLDKMTKQNYPWQIINPINSKTTAVILSFGPHVEELKRKIDINKLDYALINCACFNDIDENILTIIVNQNLPIVIYNLEHRHDLLSSNVKDFLYRNEFHVKVYSYNLEKAHILERSRDLKYMNHLNIDDVLIDFERRHYNA